MSLIVDLLATWWLLAAAGGVALVIITAFLAPREDPPEYAEVQEAW